MKLERTDGQRLHDLHTLRIRKRTVPRGCSESVAQDVVQHFHFVFQRPGQFPVAVVDRKAAERELRIGLNEFFQFRDLFLHLGDLPGQRLLLLLPAAEIPPVLELQYIQLLEAGFDYDLAPEFRIAGNRGREAGVVQRAVIVDLLNGAGTAAFHRVVDEFLLAFEDRVHSGVKRLLDSIADDLHFFEDVALTDDASLALLYVGRPERTVEVVFDREAFLNVDAGSEFHGRADDYADLSRIHPLEQVGFLLVGVVIADHGNLIGGDAVGDQFALDLLPGIEQLDAVADIAVKVAKNHLRPFDGLIGPVFVKNIADADIQLGFRVILKTRIDQPRIDRHLATHAVNQQRNMRKQPLVRVILIPFVQIAEVVHESGNHRAAGNIDLFGTAPFDRRTLHSGQILFQNHVGDTSEHLREFDHVAVFGETLYHPEASRRILFQRHLHTAEYRGETVEGADTELLQRRGADVADHVPKFRNGIGDRRSGGEVDVAAAGFLHDMTDFQTQ